MRRKILLILFVLIRLKVSATHIVGGEFEVVHNHDYIYHVNMILYFDDVNGNPQAEDKTVDASIFRKKDNHYMESVVLLDQGSTFVPYTNIKCTVDQLRTRRIFYTGDIYLDPNLYNDEDGYYVVWERCCRNRIISNIERPDETGQVFYVEFPPVEINGEQFIDSTPILFPPLSDYACVNNFYYVNFTGTDLDGDSLVYSIVQPLAGFTSQNVVVSNPPRPEPYPVVNWAPGINTFNCIPGNPPLQISTEGLLTVQPSFSGLFVFSVLCEEFRDGIKIGEVRRDFQLLVIDCPDPGHPPQLMVKQPKTNYYTSHPDTIRFKQNDKKCLSFIVRDGDGNAPIKLRAKPVNFHADIHDILSITSGYLVSSADTLDFEICFPDCPYRRDKPYIIDLIAGDDACPLPLMDTVRLIVEVEPPPNHPPYFTNPEDIIKKDITAGENIHIPLTGVDADKDSLFYSVIPIGFDTAKFKMKFTNEVNLPGLISFNYDWSTDCRNNDFNDIQQFLMLVTLDDNDYCQLIDPDTIRLLVNVHLPVNHKPLVFTDLLHDTVSVKILNRLDLHIKAVDPDGDTITLRSDGKDFIPSRYGFSGIDTTGIGNIAVPFSWVLNCNTFKGDPVKNFEVLFVAEDHDYCKIRSGDTLAVQFNSLLPDNTTPVISFDNYPDTKTELLPGEKLILEITGKDADPDSIYLNMSDINKMKDQFNIVFTPVRGKGKVTSEIQWTPDCSNLADNYQQLPISLDFILNDDKCIVPAADSAEFTILLKDRDADFQDIMIPNVFTPNNDSYNEYFTVPGLPEDNCATQFEYVSIFNRYGKEVFRSKNRDFKWNGQNADPGVYYYIVRYTSKEFKGFVHILN